MATVSRLCGALLVETEGRFFLVGDLKEPCDWATQGFETPPVVPSGLDPVHIELRPSGAVEHGVPVLRVELEGEALAEELAHRFVIRRNGSVSERLWELVTEPDPLKSAPPVVDATWLSAMPREVWDVVRDSVLRCS